MDRESEICELVLKWHPPLIPQPGGSSGLSPSLPKTWCLDALLWAGTLAESAVHLCKWQHHLQDLYAPFWSHSNSGVLRRGRAKGLQGGIAVNSLIQMCVYASSFICSTFACSITQTVSLDWGLLHFILFVYSQSGLDLLQFFFKECLKVYCNDSDLFSKVILL